VPWGTQARDVAGAQRRAYLAPGVDVLVQYLVRDEQSTDAWQSGLETSSGRAKPALRSFTLPLVQVSRTGASTTLWGQVRPGEGARPYLLERLVGGTWKRLAAANTGARGFFTRKVRAEHGDRLRLTDPATGSTSPTLVVV
jgi:hypothetical protein